MRRQYNKPAVVDRITAWSYSRWACYDGCAQQAKYKFIEKRFEPTSPPMQRGTEIHKISEDYIKADARPKIPSELKKLDKAYVEAWKLNAIAEEQWAFTADWEETDWFGSDTWCRIKVDIQVIPEDRVIKIIDVKTGKVRDDYENQLELYATGALLLYDVDKVICENWYVDQGEIRGGEKEGFVYTPDDLEPLKAGWNKRVKKMLADTRFAPNPSDKCRWCHFRKANGGPCQY